MELWQKGNDIIWLNHGERDCNVLFIPASEKYALSFQCIDPKIISGDIVNNLGGDALLIHDGWTSGDTSDTIHQPAYTQSHQVYVASGKVGTSRTNFKQISYASWDLVELVKAIDNSMFIKDLFIASSMISFYDILAEYFETFIHQEDDNIPQAKLDFVLATLATLQKKDKEENVVNIDYAKMLLERREILVNKLIAWKHYGAGANARNFLSVIEDLIKEDVYRAVGKKNKIDASNCRGAIPNSLK